MLYLKNLEALHADMTRRGQTRRRFRWETYRHGHVFDVVFLTDTSDGMVLIFGLVGGRFAFERLVTDKYQINTYVGEGLNGLKMALGLKGYGPEKFKPSFFAEFAQIIPTSAEKTKAVTYRDVRQTRVVEEADKIWFVGWRHNGEYAHVTQENLAKTRIYLGEIARRCAAENISSCWSDDASRAQDFYPPERSQP